MFHDFPISVCPMTSVAGQNDWDKRPSWPYRDHIVTICVQTFFLRFPYFRPSASACAGSNNWRRSWIIERCGGKKKNAQFNLFAKGFQISVFCRGFCNVISPSRFPDCNSTSSWRTPVLVLWRDKLHGETLEKLIEIRCRTTVVNQLWKWFRLQNDQSLPRPGGWDPVPFMHLFCFDYAIENILAEFD